LEKYVLNQADVEAAINVILPVINWLLGTPGLV